MLLTRSPLSPAPKGRFSLDLHVLSAPPAFVLSQDQTLREEVIAATADRQQGSKLSHPTWTAVSLRTCPLRGGLKRQLTVTDLKHTIVLAFARTECLGTRRKIVTSQAQISFNLRV